MGIHFFVFCAGALGQSKPVKANAYASNRYVDLETKALATRRGSCLCCRIDRVLSADSICARHIVFLMRMTGSGCYRYHSARVGPIERSNEAPAVAYVVAVSS